MSGIDRADFDVRLREAHKRRSTSWMGAKRCKNRQGGSLAWVKEPKPLDLSGFCQCEGILYIDAQISDGTFNFCVAQQNLNGSQVASLFIND